MNDIEVGRYSGILHKLLGIREGSPAPTLAPEIFPMLVLESDRPEWAFLGNERLCQTWMQVGAAAGEYSLGGVLVPAGSNVIAVIDQITVARGAAGDIATRMVLNTAVSAATGQDGVMRDSRLYGVGSAAQGFFDSVVAVPGASLDYWRDGALTNASVTRDVEYVLTPGYGIFVYPTSVNTLIKLAFRWRERVLEPTELR